MSLRSFLEQMETKEVLHVKDEVYTHFKIPFITKNFDSESPILLFERVKNYEAKVVANVCGTRKIIYKALNINQNGLYGRLREA